MPDSGASRGEAVHGRLLAGFAELSPRGPILASAEPSLLELLRQVDFELSQRESPRVALSRALQVLLPRVCQQAVLSIDELDGSTSMVTAFIDPELERLAIEINRRYPPKPTVHPAEVAARTGAAHVGDVTDELMASIAHDTEHLALLRQFGATQLLVFPLRHRNRVLGVLALSTDHGRRFNADERMLAELVATRVAIHLGTAYFRRRVLVADDDASHRALLESTLSRAGFDVRGTTTGADALRLAREIRPDVVVLDADLPDLPGGEVCRQLKADERTRRIPVVELSPLFDRAELRELARADGADDFLVAPVEPSNLLATVESLVYSLEEETASRRSVERERFARIALERANARLRAITESGLLGTFEWGPDGLLVDANDGFLRMVGHTRDDLLSGRLRVQALLAEPAAAFSALPAAPLAVERDLIARDGQHVSVLLGMAPSSEPEYRVAFVLDVSESRRRSEFEALLVGIVSHDLRNPLGIVTMAASLLLAQDMAAPQRKLAQRIEGAGRKAARLIADLLDFTVARGSGIHLSLEPRDLHDLVAQAVEDAHATWPERMIVHERVGEATFPVDQARFEQIASNLIGNALQHSPATTSVTIETRGECEAVVFSVHNDGKPISAELMPQLFAPLRRGEDAGHRRGSIGLGLFIVHHLVERHGGTISVTSSEAAGTRFTVRLPRPSTPRVPDDSAGLHHAAE
jgi:phosphoserine phosphatase RsbU/P